MPVDRNLNIAIPVDTARFGEIWVHSTPIARPVFERYFLVLGRAFTMVVQVGGAASAARIAALCLKEAATGMGVWEGEVGVERGLMAEIHRLTNVVIPSEKGGWETMPLPDAKAAGILDEEDFAEVEGAVVFFYLGLSHAGQESGDNDPGGDEHELGCADYLVEQYGLRRLIADIDRDRDFWRDAPNLVGATLAWLANEGFEDWFSRHGIEEKSAHEWRQRHMLHLLARRRVW